MARGFAQKYDLDYDKVIASVIGDYSIRVLLEIFSRMSFYSIEHLDCNTAFLNVELKEEVHMEIIYMQICEYMQSKHTWA